MTIDDYRINLLAATEIRNVVDVYPEILDFQIDPETGSIEGYAEGKGRTRILRYKRDERVQSEPTQTGASADYVGGSEALGEGESWLAGHVAKARLRPGGDFIGETTLARTLVGLASSRGRELGNLFQRGQFDELGVSDIRPGGVQVGRPGLRVEPRSGGVSEDYVFYSPAERAEQAPSRVKGDAAKRVKTSAINLLYSKQGDVAESVTSIPGVAKLLKDMAEEQWGGKITSATITPEQEAAIVDNAADEVFAALEAEGENAGDWYTESVKRAVKVMGVIFPEIVDDEAAMKTGFFGSSDDAALGMMMAMAITSQNLKVSQNTEYAVEQFRHLLKTGKFNHKKSYGGKAESISGNLDLANMIVERLGWSGANDFLSKEFTVAELRAECKRLGLDTSIDGKVDDVVNGALILGPKIGQGFLQNLLGRFDPVTIDLWMRRTWGRWTGDVMAESFSGEQVARLIDAMNESGDRLPAVLSGIEPITGQRASTGSKFRTLSESDLNKVRADESAVFEFAKSKVSQWEKLFKSMSFPVRKTVYDSWRKGDITADQMIVEIQADIASAKKYIKDNKVKAEWDAAGKKWNSDSAAKQIMKGRADTVLLTKEQKKGIKPEWAFASKVVKDLLGPIDLPSNMDREVITRVVNKIRKRVEASGFRTTNADIQAILWYPEKDLWNNLANKKADKLKSAYDIEFLKIADELGLGDEARKQIR